VSTTEINMKLSGG